MEGLARGTVVVAALQGMNPTLVIPTGSPVGTNTCMSWIWALHRHPSCAHSHKGVPSCVAQTGLCSRFWDAHLMPKGSTQEVGDLQPQML